MNFVEELKAASQKAIEDMALEVSINIQPKLKEYGDNGQKECFMNPEDHAGVMLTDEFINLLSELLDGVNVEVVERSTSVLFPSLTRKDIRFSW